MARSENAAEVRALWEAFAKGGVDGFLALAPEGVQWQSHLAGGATLHGSSDLKAMFADLEARGERVEAEITTVEEVGEDAVVVTGTLHRHGPAGSSSSRLAWLYSFREGQLWRATAHQSAAEAREAARFGVDPSGGRRATLVVERHDEEGLAVLTIRGELDIASAPTLSSAIESACSAGAVRLDLSGLEFMDSMGMHAILRAALSATADGWGLSIVPARESVQRVFAISGTEARLPFDPAPRG